jgi:hypothetical protein
MTDVCVHWWIIEPFAPKRELRGRCRYCGGERTFPISPDENENTLGRYTQKRRAADKFVYAPLNEL